MNILVESDGLWQRLKAATHDTHERLDRRIMAARPFESRERYGCFVQVQFYFHACIDDLYENPVIATVVPDLPERRRLHLIERDLADLGCPAPRASAGAATSTGTDVPTALGWLYVAEGSNLGAAFLLKEAVKLGLSENFGARHLAGHPDGRGLQWRRFTSALDATTLTEVEEARVIAGAEAAFRSVHDTVGKLLPV
jgi:heme oxygenase